MPEHFCTCDSPDCALHPSHHDKGCDPCMQKNARRGEIPTCLFRAVHDDVSGVNDYTMQGFVNFFTQHQAEYTEKFKK